MRSWFPVVLAAFVLSGCAHKRHVRMQTTPHPAPAPVAVGYTESGVASWYGHPYHGRAAADGEIYDMETLVAAHRTLPFNSWVRVVNLTNNKSVEVRIIDRGPFVDGRIIDLSHAAARAIDLVGPGIAQVRVDIIDAPAPSDQPPPLFAVQVGSFTDRARAVQLAADLQSQFSNVVLVPRQADRTLWRVLVGRENSWDDAAALADQIGSAHGECFVVRLDTATLPVAAVY